MLHLSRNQLREIDRRATADYHIPSILLMENAARAVVDEAVNLLAEECCGTVLILCGGGNNGGDGLAIARHMHNRGCGAIIGLCCDPSSYSGDSLINWQIISAMKIPAEPFDITMLNDPKPMLIIDAIFGTGLTKPPRDPFGKIAQAINESRVPIMAVDLPSGLDCDTGVPPGACIRANCTVTFVAEKIGFTHPTARSYLGKVIVGDIACPIELIENVSRSTATTVNPGSV